MTISRATLKYLVTFSELGRKVMSLLKQTDFSLASTDFGIAHDIWIYDIDMIPSTRDISFIGFDSLEHLGAEKERVIYPGIRFGHTDNHEKAANPLSCLNIFQKITTSCYKLQNKELHIISNHASQATHMANHFNISCHFVIFFTK